ncbi:MAG: hypothetical protein HFG33_02070 [Bacilli bacterium]|nr:hypothetical protein [Bacilli bacterium]
MRKTVLMLINGFGVEQKDSAEVYSAKLMPNMDYMVKNYLFGSLLTNAGDYNNAYRMFSIPEKTKGKEDEIDFLIFEKKLDQNEVLKNVRDNIGEENCLHIFYAIENISKFGQVREFLRIINASKNKKVFLHFILTGTSTSGYDDIIKVISKISFELSDYCKIGMVLGRNKINTDDVQRVFYRELGEHWNESTKKFDILKREIVNPEDAGVFMISGGFALKENDSVLFINYEDVEMEKFYSDFTKIPLKLYSLYPFKEGIPYMFKREEERSTCFSSVIETHGIRILHLTTEARINDVNFYLNGMEKRKSPNITYALNDMSLFSTKEKVVDLLESNPYDGVIIDYVISGYNRMEDIKRDLQNIDGVIKNISDAAKERDYTFIISSLYGMHVPVMEGVVQKVINFSGKVPCIFQSNLFTKQEYSLNTGNTYSLSQTFLTNINDEVKANKLVHKLSSIEKMLSKGK